MSLKCKNYNLFTELCFTGRIFNAEEAFELGLAIPLNTSKLNKRV